LDNLIKEGFIEKQHGKGSRLKERRNSLGLLNVKGSSEAVGQNVKTIFLLVPAIRKWNPNLSFQLSSKELQANCLHFERLRCVGDDLVIGEAAMIIMQYEIPVETIKYIFEIAQEKGISVL
jgi:GntR family transcriptional regulator/GntR family frlABCD operon transcriptional regulator